MEQTARASSERLAREVVSRLGAMGHEARINQVGRGKSRSYEVKTCAPLVDLDQAFRGARWNLFEEA